MHACGHDTHTAMLAGAARILSARQAELAGEVRFMFQPGEEGFHGARFMLDDGLLDPLPDAAFAIHIMPNAAHGVLGSRDGALLAAADMLEITVRGRGGHASMPHDTRDPVPVACEIVGAIQTLVTRRFNAAEAVVVTITQLDAGSAHNIIPDTRAAQGHDPHAFAREPRAKSRRRSPSSPRASPRRTGWSAESLFIRGLPADDQRSARGRAGRSGREARSATSRFQRMAHPIMGRGGLLLRARESARRDVLPRRRRGRRRLEPLLRAPFEPDDRRRGGAAQGRGLPRRLRGAVSGAGLGVSTMDDANRIATLEKLANLHRAGSLSAEEYAAEKAKLLADDAGGGAGGVVSTEEPVEQFHGSTVGWLFGALLGWLVILLCLWPIAAFALSTDDSVRYVSLALLAAGFAAIVVRWIGNVAKKYELTTQRLILRTGILFKRVDEIELYRVKDSRVDFSLLNQLTGIGTITLRSSDVSSQETDFTMRDVPRARAVRESIRTLVDQARQRRRVRELDIDEWGA